MRASVVRRLFGGLPGWEQQLAKNAQKDKDARWTKKNDESFYGYKNHLGVDKAHKLIRKWDATDAAVHDSQKLGDLLDLSNTGNGVWADSAYRSDQIEANLKTKGLQSRIHRRAARNLPLSSSRNASRACANAALVAPSGQSRASACKARSRPTSCRRSALRVSGTLARLSAASIRTTRLAALP